MTKSAGTLALLFSLLGCSEQPPADIPAAEPVQEQRPIIEGETLQELFVLEVRAKGEKEWSDDVSFFEMGDQHIVSFHLRTSQFLDMETAQCAIDSLRETEYRIVRRSQVVVE